MWRRSFLILHGGENRRPAGHWQYDLAQRLRQRREQVFYPHIPDGYGPCPSVLEWCLDPQGHGIVARCPFRLCGPDYGGCRGLLCGRCSAAGGGEDHDCPFGCGSYSWHLVVA
jgi:hypothetical protein